jgi:dihydrofolate reductase
MSLDGFVAGPRQSVDNPLGIGGMRLHQWIFPLRIWRAMHGLEGGEVNESARVVEESLAGIGASVMGRNLFGGHPGPWDANRPWNGWWGVEPPFHHPVFVLTHYAREPLALQGGTTFTFVTDGIEAALELARRAAGGKDVSLAGGRVPHSSISRPTSWTRWRSASCRHSSATASGCSKASATICTGSNSCGRSPRQT